jgi:hypothetical protein
MVRDLTVSQISQLRGPHIHSLSKFNRMLKVQEIPTRHKDHKERVAQWLLQSFAIVKSKAQRRAPSNCQDTCDLCENLSLASCAM